jgi:hypothetical protein
VLRQMRRMFMLREEVDVFYILYVGHTQKLTGRWVCTDGFIDFYDVLHLWEQARSARGTNSGYPRPRSRLIIISDNPNSGSWVEQHRAALAAVMPPAAAGPFAYSLSNPNAKRPKLRHHLRSRGRSHGRAHLAGEGAAGRAADSRGMVADSKADSKKSGAAAEGARQALAPAGGAGGAAAEASAAGGGKGRCTLSPAKKGASAAVQSRSPTGTKLPFVVCGGGQRGGSPSMIEGCRRARKVSLSPTRRSQSPAAAGACAALAHAGAFVVTGGGQRGGATHMVPGGPRRHKREEGRGRRGLDGSLSPDGGGAREGGCLHRELGPGMAIGDYDKIAGVQEAARVMAVMSSCSPTERALENSDGGSFFSSWARHAVQGKLCLEGVCLSAPQIQAPGAGCRQHPMLSVGWCLSPADGDPLLMPAGVGLYLTGPSFYVP